MTTLTDTIDRFVKDTDLAHQFVHGGPTDEVVGEKGSYPSLAKIAADAEALLALLLQNRYVQETFNFNQNSLDHSDGVLYKLYITHNHNTVNFMEVIRNVQGDRVYAKIDIVNNNAFTVEFTEAEAGSIMILFF